MMLVSLYLLILVDEGGSIQEPLFTRNFMFPLVTDCLQKACCHPHSMQQDGWLATSVVIGSTVLG